MSVIEKINTPADLRGLTEKELLTLAQELREKVISVTRKNGGHLASNLGVIETTLALNYVFDFKSDRLIFDVGHQCYAHKILTERKDAFDTIRTLGGLSGFPDKEESVYDAFTAGHAGTSVSAGLGYCAARDKLGKDYYVVDVVGDGSVVNGLNLEAMTASTAKPRKFIVILNDNGMSISANANGFYQFISKYTTKRVYVKSKSLFKRVFKESFVTRGLRRFKNALKRKIGKNNYFENFGFKYVGEVDGNDLLRMIKILKRVKNVSDGKAVLLHVNTRKGKGLSFAEERADLYHGVGKNLETGSGLMSDALGDALCSAVKEDKRVVCITAGMKDGTGLIKVEKQSPKSFMDVGIAEEYAVTMAAGMAAGGLKPVVAVYSTFFQRAYDQILHDVCLPNLPVVMVADRAGLVGADGKTHQGVFDLSYACHIPNLTVVAPASSEELKEALTYAFKLNAPCFIRYPNIKEEEVRNRKPFDGKWEVVREGKDTVIVYVGPRMEKLAFEISEKLGGVGIINARVVKPLDEALLSVLKYKSVVTLEENAVLGGFGERVAAFYKNDKTKKVGIFGVPDRFIPAGGVDEQLKECGLTADNVIVALKNGFKGV